MMLSVRDLAFTYPGGRQALRGFNLDLASGEKVALLGPNGAGKSTLLLRLGGAYQGEGSISLDGRELAPNDLPTLRQAVGLVFQNPDDQLFCPTVAEDVAYGPLGLGLEPEEVEKRVNRALQAVGLEAARDRFPQNLSGGEKKRAALATILAMEPRVLVLDEPTAGLDARSRRSLVAVLHQLKTALLVATHDLGLARELTTRCLVLDEGQVMFDGATADLMKQDDLLYRHGLLA